MRLSRDTKKYLNFGLIAAAFVVGYSLLKRFLSSGTSLLDLIKVRSDVKQVNNPDGVDVAVVDGIVQTIYSAFYGFEWMRIMQWADDDKIIRELNKLTNIYQVRYASEAFKTRYNRSLKADVEYALPDSSLRKISSIVQSNWY